ncbi:MAG: hypothetical protein ABS939_06845 [Psychrobacillus sp.]
MISYTIAMSFISWSLAILMLIGFGLLKIWEYQAKNSAKMNDIERMALHMAIEDFYEANFAGKVIKLLFFGALLFATIIGVIRGDFKDE